MTHLHLVREKNPEPLDIATIRGGVSIVPCADCRADVYLIHIDAPPIDPPKREGVP